MSLYNMVKGYHPLAPICLAMLKLPRDAIPRFRDAWLSDDGKQITVLTRTGGGNRPEYVVQNDELKALPGFVQDYDDPFDATFAHFVYAVPPRYNKECIIISTILVEGGLVESLRGPQGMIEALDKKTQLFFSQVMLDTLTEAIDHLQQEIDNAA